MTLATSHFAIEATVDAATNGPTLADALHDALVLRDFTAFDQLVFDIDAVTATTPRVS